MNALGQSRRLCLRENENFEVLNLPAIAPSTCKYQTGPNRTYTRYSGEILHPEHESVKELLELKKSMGLMAFSAQYQQTPVPVGGAYIKSKYLKSYSALPAEPGGQIVLSWDVAMREMENDD